MEPAFRPATTWRTFYVPGAVWNNLGEQSTNTNVHLRWRDYEFYAADNWKVRRNLTLDLGVRYSILAPPFQPNNQFTSFRPQLWSQALQPICRPAMLATA